MGRNTNKSPTTTKSQVLEEIAKTYDVTNSQASLLVNYHSKVRSHLNSLFTAAATGDNFETRENKAVQGTSFFGKLIGIFFPPVGTAIEGASDVASAVRSYYDEQTLKNAAEILDACGGIKNLNKLTKTLATHLVEEYAHNLAHLNPSKIKERAKNDANAIKKSISNGSFKSVLDENYSDAASLAGDEDLEKEGEQSTIEMVQEKMLEVVEKNHPTLQDHSNHEVLGSHTQKATNHSHNSISRGA